MKLVYGGLFRYSEGEVISERIDAIYDAIEDAGFTDDDWAYMAWHTSEVIYFVFASSLAVRAELMKVKGLRIAPLTYVASKMKDNRSTWVLPTASGGQSAFDVASKRLAQWQEGLFASEQAKAAPVEDEDDSVRDLTSRRERMKRAREATPLPPKDDVMAAFGMTGGEKDSEGATFQFSSLI